MISTKKRDEPCDTNCRMVKIIEKLSIEEQRILARLLQDWETRDQRCHQRFSCSIITEYRALALNRMYKDRITNVSLGGAYIQSNQRFPLNLQINLSFFLPNFEIPIQSRSQIIWAGPKGFGVQFEAITSEN